MGKRRVREAGDGMKLRERYSDLSRKWPEVEQRAWDRIAESHALRQNRRGADEPLRQFPSWNCCDMLLPSCFFLCPICGREHHL